MKNFPLILWIMLCSLILSSLVFGTGSVVYVKANGSTGTAYYDLWTMDPDGGNAQRLTHLDATLLRYPAWSGDGTRILFDSDYNSGYTVNINNVYMYDLRTSVLSALTGQYGEPGSCPCGAVSGHVYSDTYQKTPMANVKVRAKGVFLPVYTDDNGFYTMTNVPVGSTWVRASGTGSEWSYRDTIVASGQTTTGIDMYLSDGVYYKLYPRWSPDSTKYVQESIHAMSGAMITEIESMYPDQSGKVTMSSPSYDSSIFNPDWSPTGNRLVYIGWGGGISVRDVLVSDLDGGNRQTLVSCASPLTPCANPKWSPDGSKIIFIKDSYSVYDTTFPQASYLYLVDSDGGNPIQIYSLTGRSGRIENPAFSPDGGRIIFDIYFPNDSANVYRIDSDGNNLLQLTSDGLSLFASWNMQAPATTSSTSTTTPISTTTTTSYTSNTTTTTLGGCSLAGDEPPCDIISLSEVISLINNWVLGQATLPQVIALINAWASPASFGITSSAFVNNGNIPFKYTCNGQNINPPFFIEGIPTSAEAMALTVDDLDASGGFDHWVMWNIPLVSEIDENTVPLGAVQGVNGLGENQYEGPCPPSGETHRYRFKLYALDDLLSMPSSSGRTALENAMTGHIIKEANLTGLYIA